MRTIPASDVYCTTFCNKAHRLSNGHPINHECYILKPEGLERERQGIFDGKSIRTDRILNPQKVEVK